jgi:hypothetical protein|tara:strand:- start:311 stop:448 length:138 start_codon:yes stop_codon:yes gene_type:complete
VWLLRSNLARLTDSWIQQRGHRVPHQELEALVVVVDEVVVEVSLE